jgi:hypothetical protein
MPKRRFAAAAAAAAFAVLPLGAAAQDDVDDPAPWSALPSDISEEPLPESYFRDNLIGRYAAPGRCGTDAVDDLLVISAVGIQIGPVLCEGVGKMTWEDGRLLVPLSTCRIDTRHQGARTLSLERLTGGDLFVRSDAEDSFVPNEVMQRCGP